MLKWRLQLPTWHFMCAGRRGRKRKAEAPLEEEVAEQPSAEPAAEGAEETAGCQDARRVVIEHWYVCHGGSRWITHPSTLMTIMHGYRVDCTIKSDGSPLKPIAFHVLPPLFKLMYSSLMSAWNKNTAPRAVESNSDHSGQTLEKSFCNVDIYWGEKTIEGKIGLLIWPQTSLLQTVQ